MRSDDLGLRFQGKYLLDIECKNKANETVYPYLVQKREGGGEPVFDVSISGRSDDYRGYDLPGLLRLFRDGAFDKGAQLRMQPLNGGPGGGHAPMKGQISERFLSLVRERGVVDLPVATHGEFDSQGRVEFALADLAISPEAGTVDRALRVRNEHLRNPAVRQAVLRYANGVCEYCRRPSFLMPSGGRYLEAHHVIALANDGEDSVGNVIALCPEHHREAHFGAAGEELEKEFMKIIAGRQSRL